MRLLKKTALAAAALPALLVCSARGPLTPQDAFESLAEAYARRDAAAVMGLMSKPSLRAIDEILARIRGMAPAQRASLAEHMGVPLERLDNLTRKDYIALQIELGALHGNDPLGRARRQRIVATRVDAARARVLLENGMELDFVREGPYWRFDAREW